MKILFITPSFYPSIGGVEKYCFEIGKRLIAKGHKVTVITEKKTGRSTDYQRIDQTDTNDIIAKKVSKSGYIERYEYKEIKIFAFKFGKSGWLKKFRIWFYLIKNIDLIKNADVIHCHDVFIWYLPLRFILFRKKVYVTFHGYESFPIRKAAIIVRKISEILTNGNICVGDFIKKWYHTKPDFIIYGGVNIPSKNSINKSKSALFFGRLDEQTGILEYAKAVEIIKKKIPTFKFEVIGSGKYEEKIKFKTKKFMNNVEVEIPKYRYIFVSRYLSILEALVARRMVFALFDNPVKKDYLKMSPFSKFISITNTPQQLAKSVEFYIKNPKKELESIDGGYSWVKKQTWENVVDIYLRLWNLS